MPSDHYDNRCIDASAMLVIILGNLFLYLLLAGLVLLM